MRIVGIGVILIVIGAVIAGFVSIGSPAESRARRMDQQRISHLALIQGQLVQYWQMKQSLPKELNDLIDDISGFRVPDDPESGKPYEYASKGELTFNLCATFSQDGGETEKGRYPPFRKPMPMKPVPYPDGGSFVSESWQHGAGRVCFERTIDPERYTPYREKPD